MRFTLVLALLLPLPLAAQSADDKKATIQFLVGLQQPDGGFVATPGDAKAKSSLRATSAAVRAIKYLGGEVPNKATTTEFVKACYHRNGFGFADEPTGKVSLTATAVGMMAAAELYLDEFMKGNDEINCASSLVENARTFEDRRLAVAGMEAAKVGLSKDVEAWFAEVRKTANPDGTYGNGDGQARETGGVIAMFLRYGKVLSDAERKAVIAALRSGQRPDGGFGKAGEKASDGETTYRVMRAFHLLKEKPKDVAKLKEFIGKCRNSDGGYGVAPGQPSTVSGTYYAAVVNKWLGE